MDDKIIVERALMESKREGVTFPYRLVMIRQHEHETAGNFVAANECASIRCCLELSHAITKPKSGFYDDPK